jgi:hypothetical protein
MTINDSGAGAHATRGAVHDAVDRQRDRFGGITWGAAFFGWLSANGLAVLLVALLSAGGVAIGLTQGVPSTDEAAQQADTIGIAGGIALLVVLFLAYLAGGYVAGRMARFDGVRQGIAVWVIGLLVVIALAVLGLVLGSKYNVLQSLNRAAHPDRRGHGHDRGHHRPGRRPGRHARRRDPRRPARRAVPPQDRPCGPGGLTSRARTFGDVAAPARTRAATSPKSFPGRAGSSHRPPLGVHDLRYRCVPDTRWQVRDLIPRTDVPAAGHRR